MCYTFNMKEIELTVRVYEREVDIDRKLKKIGYKLEEEYTVKDIYMTDANNLNELSNFEILERSILLRNINSDIRQIVYKKKNINEKDEVLSEEKYKIPVKDLKNAQKFFECIGYRKIFEMNNYVKLYKKDDIELHIEMIYDLGIFLEIEATIYDESALETRTKLKRILKDLPIEIGKNFDVRKAHLMLDKKTV